MRPSSVLSNVHALSNYSMVLSINSADYESIRAQLHNTRLENAANRAKINQINREKLELSSQLGQQSQAIKKFKDDFSKQKLQEQQMVSQLIQQNEEMKKALAQGQQNTLDSNPVQVINLKQQNKQ